MQVYLDTELLVADCKLLRVKRSCCETTEIKIELGIVQNTGGFIY